ncbi:mechanosensitive ion channel protein MscS [Chitiniphilus shinanonensis]|uniref:Small-conductance mechanosensitive channel n=1 Tax=Chitiniphilus shinanonensis TaxID=553088 RepID=A0ABQ6BVV6_9NEIS|nr:mechanosensitive ion channel family protein [Chitiniphilus shinanonensis]GLS04327.1 mechanosensitive ion channel protein MscS [Chitiniphilus shinanonensis]
MIRAYLALLLLCLAGLLQAAAPDANHPVTARILNRDLVTFRAPLSGYTPEQRAAGAEKRIQRLLEHPADPALVNVSIGPSTAMLEYDGVPLFSILHADVDVLGGDTLDSTAQQAQQALQAAITDSQSFRDPMQYVWAGSRVALATVAMLLALWLLRRMGSWLSQRATNLLMSTANRAPAGVLTVTPGSARRLVHHLGLVIFWPLLLLIGYRWLSVMLAQFPRTRIWAEQLDRYVLGFLEQAGSAVLDALPGLATAVFIVAVTRWLTRLLNVLFLRVESGQLSVKLLDPDTASTTRRLLICLTWLVALAMIYPYLPGADTDAFKGLSVMVGLMVSLGASSVVSQFASGLILIYSRSLKVGEYVQIGDHEGTVAEIGLFATKIHTNLREEVAIPNSVLVSQNVKNFSRLAGGGGVIVSVVMTIGYDTPWRQVEAMMLEGARRTAGIRNHPEPMVLQTALSDFYVEYNLRVALDEPRRRLEILDELHGHLQDVFNEYGVQIMSPNYEDDPESPKIVPPANWYLAPARKPAADNAG